MEYTIELSNAAKRDLKKIKNKKIAQKIVDKIKTLSSDPHPKGVKKIRGKVDLYRIRIVDHRVIYTVKGTELLILVLKIGSRKDVYKK